MLLLLLAACETTTVSGTTSCSLGVPTLGVAAAAPGDTVTLTAAPLTEVWDTAVTVGPARATLVDLDRSTCDECDDCRDTEGCAACGECATCDTTCATCAEVLSFVVPDLAPGTWSVEIVNRYGRSEQVNLVVTAPTDTPADTADTSTP